jgi:hypothetical protein
MADKAKGMPGKLSGNEPGIKKAGSMARFSIRCPLQGMNEKMIAESAIKPITNTFDSCLECRR